MKKTLLFCLFTVASFAFIGAQSFQLENAVSSVSGSPDDFEMEVHASIRNTSSTAKNVRMKSMAISTPENTIYFFCWELCYGPGTFVSPTSLTIGPGESINNFHGYYRPQGVSGEATICYTFYDEANPSDSVQLCGQFSALATGITNAASAVSSVSVYPNPASETAFLKYTLTKTPSDATVEIYNMLGARILTYPVANKEGVITIPVEQLKGGLYFYSFKENGKLVRSGRLTVKH